MSTQILNPEATSLLINAFGTNTGTALANIATGVTGPGSPTLCTLERAHELQCLRGI